MRSRCLTSSSYLTSYWFVTAAAGPDPRQTLGVTQNKWDRGGSSLKSRHKGCWLVVMEITRFMQMTKHWRNT